MKQRIGRKNYFVYALDIESHNDDESIAKKETSMWLGCFIDENSKVDDESSYFYTWEELLSRLEDLTKIRTSHKKREGQNVMIYVYNLAFEYSFLLPRLFANGWTWKNEFSDTDEKVFNAVTTKTCSSCWNIRLYFDKKHKSVEFRDLGKIYQGGIRSVAKSFGLETHKGEMDYKLNRLHNHTVTKEEKEYCFNDTRIVMEILMKVKERNDRLFWKSLSSSSYACQKMIASTYKSHKPYEKWREDYPIITGDESVFLRRSVAGGLTQVLPKYQFKDLDFPVVHIDANQMHPSSAYLNSFPYGKGEYHKYDRKEGLPHDRICCCHILFSYSGVKIHSIISLIGIDAIDDYELYLWDFEVRLLSRCYLNAKIKIIDYYAYKKKMLPWRKFYINNWDLRMEAKEKGDSFEYMNCKLLNNGSYGKLIEKPHTQIFENIISDTGISDSEIITRENQDEKDLYCARFTYIPVGSCIPAYSRVCLIKTALKIGAEYMIYTDTDSLFFEDNERTRSALKHISFENTLGGWKIEETALRSQFAVPKRYKLENEKGEQIVRAGGFNFPDEFDRMKIDLTDSMWLVRRSYRVKGGTIVDVVKKEIRVPEKYRLIYENNVIIKK